MTDFLAPQSDGVTEVSLSDIWGSLESGTLALDDWAAIMYAVRDRRRELKWLFVELLAFGMDALGEDIYQYVDDLDLADQTIHNLASLGRRWPRSKRAEMGIDLPIGYFEAVSRRWLSEDDARAILGAATERGFKRSEIRDIVRTISDERLGSWEVVDVDGRSVEVCFGGWDEYRERYVDPPISVLPPCLPDQAHPDPLPGPVADAGPDEILVEFVVRSGLGLEVANKIDDWLHTEGGRAWLRAKAESIL